MMKRTERIFLEEIEKTNKLIDQLKGRLNN